METGRFSVDEWKDSAANTIFFHGAKWCYQTLNLWRLRYQRNQENFSDKRSDFAVVDGSVAKKNKDSVFRGLSERMWSNRDKQVVNGFHILGASIVTKTGQRYFLDFWLYFSWRWKSEIVAWKAFAASVCKQTKAWMFLLDSGFKGAYFCSYVYLELGREFLVRIGASQTVLIKDKQLKVTTGKKKRGRKKLWGDYTSVKISDCLVDQTAIQFNHGRLWVLKDVLIKSWIKEFQHPVQVIVFWQNGRRQPMVLVTSVSSEKITNVCGHDFGFIKVSKNPMPLGWGL